MIKDGCGIEDLIKIECHAPHRYPPRSPFGWDGPAIAYCGTTIRSIMAKLASSRMMSCGCGRGRGMRSHSSVTPLSAFEAPRYDARGLFSAGWRLSCFLLLDLL